MLTIELAEWNILLPIHLYKDAEIQWLWNITTNIENITQNVKGTINTSSDLTFVSGVWACILLTKGLKWLQMSLGPVTICLPSLQRVLGPC